MELRKWKFFVIDLFHILYMYYVYVYVCVCVCIHMYVYMYMGFPGSSDGKDSACNVGNLGQPLCWVDTLQEGMAVHSSILAWRIPWTEEPGGRQVVGSQRVRHG